MHKTFRKRQKPIFSLIFSALILLTIPIAIYSLVNSTSFDTRHFAQQEEKTHCAIHIPYVNTKTLDKNRKYQIHVYSNFEGDKIKSVRIEGEGIGELFSKQYSPNVEKISETFSFSPSRLGEQKFHGEIQTLKGSYPCKMDENQEVVFVIERNHPPEFLTDPYFSAKPPSNSLTTEEHYEYVLEVADRDSDQIEYHYSFTPRAHWLHKTVIESGRDGKLKIRFAGTPEREGSYLANIFIHDGHNKHLSAQSWVINIGKEGSDIPVRAEPKLPIIDYEIDNEVILPEPQISKMLPKENSFINNPNPTISANLIASHNATIQENSIVFKLNERDLSKQVDVVKISEGEILLRYSPQTNLDAGEHKAYVYFKDSGGEEIDKAWNFNLEISSSDKTFLGIPTTTVIISIAGIFLVLFALSIPWIIYIAWKKDQPEDYKEIPIIKPDGESSYKKSFEKES